MALAIAKNGVGKAVSIKVDKNVIALIVCVPKTHKIVKSVRFLKPNILRDCLEAKGDIITL